MATQDINTLKPRQSAPELFEWRWHYHIPTLAIWAIGISMLVWSKVRGDNEGWRIVVPVVLAFVLWRMEGMGIPAVTLAAAWFGIWFTNRRKMLDRR